MEHCDPAHALNCMAALRTGMHHDMVILAADGSRIPAHRAILSLNSTYFHSLLEAGFQEAGSQEIQTNSSVATLSALLDFVYTGRIEITAATILELVEEAAYYGIGTLQGALIAKLTENITRENVLPCVAHALEWNNADLRAACSRYVLENGDLVLPVWTRQLGPGGEGAELVLGLGAQFVRDILGSSDLRAAEQDVLEFVIAWCEAVGVSNVIPTSAAGEFGALADLVRFGLLEASSLEEAFAECSLVSKERVPKLQHRPAVPTNAKPRAHVHVRWGEVPSGVEVLDDTRYTVRRVEGFDQSSGKHIKGDATVLTENVFEPNTGVHTLEIHIDSSPQSQIFLGFWGVPDTTPPSADATPRTLAPATPYSFASADSHTLDLFSGQIFIQEEGVDFLEHRVKEASRVALVLDTNQGCVTVRVDGKTYGRAFSGLNGRYRGSLTLNREGDMCTLVNA